MKGFIFALIGLGPLLALPAAPAHFSSGPARVSLVELFTSEGCSSCPPADRRLAAMREDPRLWRDYVPIAFHVNYWDNLGWKDRLASRAATERQYAYGQQGAVRSIYTPCFIVDGREWQPRGKLPSPRGSPGILTLEPSADGGWRVSFTPAPGRPAPRRAVLQAHVALLGGGLSSRVTDGENSGRTLRHEFVALVVVDRALAADAASGGYRADFAVPPPAVADASRRALVAWVTREDEQAPLQATGGWLAP